MDHRFDTIVIGLGGMGASAAYHLATRGAKVIGFDQYEPAHNRGSSHGASRIIRQAYYEHPSYVPLLLRAYDLWRKLERDSGDENLLQITGGMYFGAPDSDTVSGSMRSAVQYNLPHELLDSAEISRRYPVFRARPDEVAVWEHNAGFVRPERAIQACLQQATRHGAMLHFNEPVSGWEVTAARTVRVTTSRGSYECASLVLTPGPWTPHMFPDLTIPLAVQRHVMAWFDPVGGIGPFMPDRFPIYLWENNLHSIFYGFPAINGPAGGAKIAMHTGGEVCTPESIDRTTRPHDENELREQMAERLPALNGPLLTACTCMYTMTPDQHFVAGLHPSHSQVAMACGFSGHGFKFAPVIGEILADLALAGDTAHPIDFLSPQRFS
ncbi:MAG TPA: N-methyl-L-tryptophan oxidase [Acidobacteriaceae bacterium]|nr:N-methyl-L-tryptophan oxidase [Acidobacteriaceae bacterium]